MGTRVRKRDIHDNEILKEYCKVIKGWKYED